ncbi:protein giant [Aedes albopictus]|uniref:BZIP domain-containing protein n=1 Tax=Aedes albopictus TaxID=7160 RepID=A0ABM1Z179_AEDAL|nr:protein giant-like [Aedes albopictus]
MIAQFMMDLKTDHRTSPSLYFPNSPRLSDSCRPDSTDSGVLDLSKRRDSVETRKTPSPYASFSEEGSPPLHRSLHNSNNALLINYHASIHPHPQLELPLKAPLPYESPNHLDHSRLPLSSGFHPTQNLHLPQHPIIPKQEILPQRPQLPPYLMRADPTQQQSQFPRSPLHAPREPDSLSESGSEGHSLPGGLKLPLIKQPTDAASNGPYPMVVGRDGKLARPFKAYPRDPLSLAAGFMASDSMLDANSAEKYNMFRKRMLEQIHAANGGQPTISNPKMRRLNKSLSDTSETESVPDKMPEPSSQHHPKATPTDRHPCSDAEAANHNSAPISDADGSSTSNGVCSNVGSTTAPAGKDSAYYERRKKNNAAAKKSRDRRRIKEDEIAIRAAFLERENIELKFELAAARKQLALYGVVTGGSP